MPTAKPPFSGDRDDVSPREFSKELRDKLRTYYPVKNIEPDPAWGHPADAFVEKVLAEAWYAIDELDYLRFDITKQELRAEQADLLKLLREAEEKLRNLSPDLDRLLLKVGAVPLACEIEVQKLVGSIEDTLPLVDEIPRAPGIREKQHSIAFEMALRVLRVLQEHGIKPAATGDSYSGYSSAAVEILLSRPVNSA